MTTSGNMTIEQASAQRVTELEHAFRALAKRVPGMAVEIVGHVRGNRRLVHPVAGFTVRLHDEAAGVGAALYVSSAYGELTLWRDADGDGGALRERFNVRLADSFVWGDSEYPSAEPLATDLLGYLQFNFDRARERNGAS